MNVRERIINKVISNVLNEAYGFNKYKKYGKKTPSDPNAQRKGKLQMEHPVVKKYKDKTTGKETEYIVTYLTHVWSDGAQKLADAINAAVPGHILKAQVDGYKVQISVNISSKNEIPTVINKMCEGIKQLNDYEDGHVESICDRFFNFIDTVATGEDLENEKRRSIGTWKSMLEKLNDPEVRKSLLRYQMSDEYGCQYGNVLSPKNVMRVLSQFPMASFVTEKDTWEREFNRKVMPGAQRIIVSKPVKGFPSKEQLNAAAELVSNGKLKTYAEARRKYSDSSQMMNKIRIEADKKCKNFINVAMYDVSQTIPPSDPSKDKWTLEIGLSDNITGVINQAAKDFDDSMGSSFKGIVDSNKEKMRVTHENLWKYRRMQLTNFCAKKGVDLSRIQNEDDGNFVARATYLYSKEIMPAYGIIKKEDINRLSAMCAATMCWCCGIEPLPSDLSKFLGGIRYELSDEDAVVAFAVVDGILPNLSVRTDDIKMLTKESIIRRRLYEKKAGKPITLGQFKSMCLQRYGLLSMEDNGMFESYNAMRNKVKRIVTEEINNLIRR